MVPTRNTAINVIGEYVTLFVYKIEAWNEDKEFLVVRIDESFPQRHLVIYACMVISSKCCKFRLFVTLHAQITIARVKSLP